MYFPQTLGGVCFDKSGKLFGGRKTELFRCVANCCESRNLSQTPTFPGNDQRGSPFGNPKIVFFLNF